MSSVIIQFEFTNLNLSDTKCARTELEMEVGKANFCLKLLVQEQILGEF